MASLTQPGGHSDDTGAAATPSDQLQTAMLGPSPSIPIDTGDASQGRPLPGTSVGRYLVIDELGRGAMGRVLRAYDPKLQREVALKELLVARRDPDAARRLIVEARAMAQLAHPNVVGVHDVEESPRVVLVMEYVAGQTLSEWLRGDERPWTQIVAQFRSAGAGVLAAHAAGLLHRDFKPDNVLVADDGTVKVTDFGLAKVDASLSSGGSVGDVDLVPDMELTAAGLVMGTPRYMAPEQHRGETLTAAADQYALCVALWEALCGEAPFRDRTIQALAAAKVEGPPAWPASHVPRTVADAVSRGLAPDPGDRWPSVRELLDALAWDPAAHRNRWILAASGLGVLVAAAAVLSSRSAPQSAQCTGAETQLGEAWSEPRRSDARTAVLGVGKSYAADVWERVSRQIDDYSAQWKQVHRETCEATTIRGEQSAQVMDLRMGCLHQSAVQLGAMTTLLASADEAVVRNAHKMVAGLPPLARCSDVAVLQSRVEPPSADEVETVDRARASLAASAAARTVGRYAEAQREVDKAKAAIASTSYAPVRAEVALAGGQALSKVGKPDEARAALEAALELAVRGQQWSVVSVAAVRLVWILGVDQRRMDEAMHYVPLARGLIADQPSRSANLLDALGAIAMAQGDYATAEARHRKALAQKIEVGGPETVSVGRARANLGNALLLQGDYVQADVEHRAAVAILEHALGPGHPELASAWTNLANVAHMQGNESEAEAGFRRALQLLESTDGHDSPALAAARTNLGVALHAQGQHAAAVAEHRAALSASERAFGPDSPQVIAALNNMGFSLQSMGNFEDAETHHRRALAIAKNALGPDHPDVAWSLTNLAEVHMATDRIDDAEREAREALKGYTDALGAEHPTVALTQTTLARVLLAQQRPAEAAALAEQAWMQRQRDGVLAGQRAATAFVLGRALWASAGDAPTRARAAALVQRAQRDYASAGAVHRDDAAQAKRWSDAHPLP